MTGAHAVKDREAGFTLIEVTITAVILMVVMLGLLGLLESQTKSDHTVQNIVASQQDMRLAVTTVARDLRNGTVTDAKPTQVEVNVYDSPTASTPTHVRWRLDTAAAQPVLEREVIGADNSATLTYSVPVVAQSKVFTYYGPHSNELVTPTTPTTVVTAPNETDSTAVAQCTQRITVDLGQATGATATAQFDEGSDVAVRNSTATASICP